MGLNWRVAYIIFLISVSVGLASLFHGNRIASRFGNPNSAEGIEIRRVHLGLNTLVIILSIVGFIILLIEYGNKILAMVYTVALFTCILLASVVIIRTLIWRSYSDQALLWDMRNASIDYIAINGKLSRHLISVQDEHKCCGVENILEWQTPGMLNIKRRVPDTCCVKNLRKRRCGEKALPFNSRNDFFCGKKCEAEFSKNESLKVEFKNDVSINFVNASEKERESLRQLVNQTIPDVCNMTLHRRIVYFFTPNVNDTTNDTTGTGGTTTGFLEPWPVETVCFQLYHFNKTKTSYDKLLIQYVKSEGRFYTDGCMEFLTEYTAEIINTAAYYAFAMAVFAFFDIIVFYHYYWKFRLAQLAEIPVPVWFENLGSGDSAPIGIGRKSIRLTDDPELIERDIHRGGILPYESDEDIEKIKKKRLARLPPYKGRHPSVRIFNVQNRVYPTLDFTQPIEESESTAAAARGKKVSEAKTPAVVVSVATVPAPAKAPASTSTVTKAPTSSVSKVPGGSTLGVPVPNAAAPKVSVSKIPGPALAVPKLPAVTASTSKVISSAVLPPPKGPVPSASVSKVPPPPPPKGNDIKGPK